MRWTSSPTRTALSRRLGLNHIVDFRSADEVKDAPDKLPPALAPHWVNLPIGSAA